VIARREPEVSLRKRLASIAAVLKVRARIAVVALAAAAAVVAGCGGDDESEGDLTADQAQTLLGQLEEVEANVEVNSCFVAADETDNLLADIQALPDDVDGDLRRALENGADHLKILLQDPEQCQRPETTTEETTTEEEPTEETTTEETTTEEDETTTTSPTQPTTPTSPGGGSGGVGPGGTGQGGL
jgi:hypothetical protein